MPYVPCTVPNCVDRKSRRHRFPKPDKDKARFDDWIKLIANPKLFGMDPRRVYTNYRVCHKHFVSEDYSGNMYLKKTSRSSQNLPGIEFLLS